MLKLPFLKTFILLLMVIGTTAVVHAQEPTFTSKNVRLIKTQGDNPFQNVHCGLQDKNGNIWFGTTSEGVYRYDGNTFTQFTAKDGLTDNKVWSVLEDKSGNIWFGGEKGVSKFDGKTISMLTIPVTENGDDYAEENNVWSIFQDSKGTIWLGADNGLFCYDGTLLKPFMENDGEVALKNIQCIHEDKNGNMWFGSGPLAFEGVFKFDGKELTQFKPEGEGWIRKIDEDKNGALYFVTRNGGLMMYNGADFSKAPQPENLNIHSLTTILIDNSGDFWYGSDYTDSNLTPQGGLWKADGNTFKEFRKDQLLTNTSIFMLLQDVQGRIWIGTRNTGLFCYDGKTISKFSE